MYDHFIAMALQLYDKWHFNHEYKIRTRNDLKNRIKERKLFYEILCHKNLKTAEQDSPHVIDYI